MAELRLLALSESLKQAQMAQLGQKLSELGVDEMPEGDDVLDMDDVLSEDQLTDFLDRLEAHDIACDVYLPVDFEGRIDLGDQTFGSVQPLIDALEEIREELDLDAERSDDDEEEADLEMIEEQLSYAWRVFAHAAHACVERQMPLFVIP